MFRNRMIYFLLLALFSACQIIPENERYIPVQTAVQSNSLLVEFTGFLCVNCPNAAARAHELQLQYPNNLVVVEMHPKSNTFCQTTISQYDYTCPLADSIYQAMGGSSTTSFPTGVIDLQPNFIPTSSWGTNIWQSLSNKKAGQLSLSINNCNPSLRQFTASYHVDALADDTTLQGKVCDMNLHLWLVEDSIVGPQMMPDGSQNMKYVHNHVLRGALVTQPLICSPRINLPDNGISLVDCIVPDSINAQAININHCSVVAVLTDPNTLSVLDVVQQKIVP